MECLAPRKKEKQNKENKETIVLLREPTYETRKYFMKYAFPCAGVLVGMGSLSKEKLKELGENFNKGIIPEREELEDIFIAAFRRIRKLGEKMEKSYWDFEVIQEYWLINHNQIIDEGEGNYAYTPEYFNDFCKVHKAEVIDKKENFLRVRYCSKERIVRNWFVPEVKKGDIVTIHHSHAIEKIN